MKYDDIIPDYNPEKDLEIQEERRALVAAHQAKQAQAKAERKAERKAAVFNMVVKAEVFRRRVQEAAAEKLAAVKDAADESGGRR